ncbi:MAG TPA: hypothetical protein VHE80_07335 [Acidimicrobiales bacterium]|nr:hypothetical protein [Acidimicrobiales bacterium]
MGKQMEGDNRQRRQRAREAREDGSSASEEGVTLGASKQDHSLGRHDDHTEKMEAPGRGKQQPDRAANPMRPGSGN